jgi:hypothetical protein
MRAASVSPAEREGFLLYGPFLHEELMLVIEEEYAEGSVREGVLLTKVSVGMGIPLANRADELVVIVNKNELVKKYLVIFVESVQHSFHA